MRSLKVCLATLALSFGITSCVAPETATPIPQAAYVATTPAYEEWVRDQVNTYWDDVPGNGVIPLVFPLEEAAKQAEDQAVDLIISASSPPEGWFATPLQTDAIAIVLHPDLQFSDLSSEALFAIFSGSEENWSAFSDEELPIQPIVPFAGDEVRVAFEDQILQGVSVTSNALLAPHPAAAMEMVEEFSGSIAIVPLSALGADDDPIRLDGVRPMAGNGRYPLMLNLNAFAPEEPTGPMRAFLGWLQASLKADF